MPTWELVLIAVFFATVVAVGIIIAAFAARTKRLEQHYGPEYQRLVSATGSVRAAQKELTGRERLRHKLDIVSLTPSALSDFSARWHDVQTRFVDDPAAAVGAADELVIEVMRERGYPVDDFDRCAAGISVDHPQIVDDYRTAHSIHVAQERDDVSTEQQREAIVHYRALFERLLEATNDTADQGADRTRG